MIVFDVFLSAGHLNKKYISVHFGCRSVTGTTNQRSVTGIKDESLREKSNKPIQIKQKDFLKDLIIFDEFHSHNETHRVRM